MYPNFLVPGPAPPITIIRSIADRLLSVSISEVIQQGQGQVSIGDFVEKVESRGFGVLFLLFALIPALPATPPGLTLPFGMVLLALSIQTLIRRKTAWLPEKVSRKVMKVDPAGRFARMMVGSVAFCERFLKQRWTWLLEPTVIGLILILCSLGLLLPLPLVNSLLGAGICLIGLGMIEEDGLVAALGCLLGLIGVFIAGFLIYVLVTQGPTAVEAIGKSVKSALLGGR